MFTKVISVAFIASAFAQFAFAADCTRTYTVQEGDICDSISAAHNVSTYQLAVVNQGLINPGCDNLQPGQQLCLGHAGEDCQTTYTVVPDDTCDIVAAAHGLNTTMLFLNNPQINSDCTNIYIGEVLCVAQSVQVPPAPSSGTSAVVIPTTAIPANPSATAVHPTTTAVHLTTTTPTPTQTPQASNNGGHNDEDDDDLPFCDEL